MPGLIPESDIAALQRACLHEREFQKEQEEARKSETKKTLEEEAKQEAEVKAITENKIETAATVEIAAQEPLHASLPPSRVPSFTTLLVPSQVTSRFGSEVSLNHLSAPAHRASVSLSHVPRIGTVEAPDIPSASIYVPQTGLATTYTPHDRGHYLAYSAPGSRHASVDNTPFVSRPVSPTHSLSVRGYGHSSLLRPTASTSRLNQLLHEEGVRRALSPLAEDRSSRRPSGSGAWNEDMVANLSVAQGWIDPDDIDAFVQTVSRRPSRPSSRQLSRAHSPVASAADEDLDDGLFLPGLGHPAVICSSSRIQSRSQSPMPPFTSPNHRMGSVDHDAGSRPPSRPYSPVRPPNYDSAESAAYLRSLAQRHYEMVISSARSRSPLPPATEDTHYDIGDSVELDQSSRSQSPAEPVYPYGLQQRTSSPPSAFPAWQSAFPSRTPTPTPTSYIPKPLNTGRPRAASQALNEAYNAANPPGRPVFTFPNTEQRSPKCAIHDETCDGKTVTHLHLTARAMRGAGFVEPYPMIKGEGEGEEVRYMVDWAALRDDEVERMRRGGVYLLA